MHWNPNIWDLSEGLRCRVAACGFASVTCVSSQCPGKEVGISSVIERRLVLWPASKRGCYCIDLKWIKPAVPSWGMVAHKLFAVMLWGLINWKELMERNLNGRREVNANIMIVWKNLSVQCWAKWLWNVFMLLKKAEGLKWPNSTSTNTLQYALKQVDYFLNSTIWLSDALVLYDRLVKAVNVIVKMSIFNS